MVRIGPQSQKDSKYNGNSNNSSVSNSYDYDDGW
jgi:hypothetical protein